MMIPSFLMDAENWTGHYYELAMEFSPKGDDNKILAALKCIGNIPWFQGAWNRLEDYQPIEMVSLENQYVGTLTIGDEKVVGCAVHVIHEDAPNGSDWIDIAIPSSMLERVFPVDYPLSLKKNPWIHVVDDLFLDIAKRIYDVAPFQLGIIGEEVSGYTSHRSFMAGNINRGIYILPRVMVDKVSEFCRPVQLTSDLSFLPMDE